MKDQQDFEGFSSEVIPAGEPEKFRNLQKSENIALIRVIRERRPYFQYGNQYRESLNALCKAGIDHAADINTAILNLALRITRLSDEREEKILELLPITRERVDRAAERWKGKIESFIK